jgi:hypothetical protein
MPSQDSEVPQGRNVVIQFRTPEEAHRAREPILKEAREFDRRLLAFWKKKDAEKNTQK